MNYGGHKKVACVMVFCTSALCFLHHTEIKGEKRKSVDISLYIKWLKIFIKMKLMSNSLKSKFICVYLVKNFGHYTKINISKNSNESSCQNEINMIMLNTLLNFYTQQI